MSCFPATAWAHRQKRVLSTLEWNTRSKRLEITHILHLHDAEQALSLLNLLKRPDLSNLKAQAKLALYIQKKFQLKTLAGETIETEILGAEIQSGRIYIYLEAARPFVPDGLFIENSILQDVYSDQINTVNVDFGGGLQTLTFSAGDTGKKILA